MKILIPIIFVLSIISCSFYSLAGSIPTHIKSIHIPLFENQTSEFDLAENITDFITNEFNESGVLRVENNQNCNSVLKGKIKSISDGPYTYDKEESVSEYRYKIDVHVEWYDLKNDKNIIESNYSGYGAYGVSGDIGTDGIDNDFDGKIDDDDDDEFGEPRSFATKVAMSKIAEDILNDIMTTW
jgi:hypothetical protein